MSMHLDTEPKTSKREQYQSLLPQIQAMIQGEPDLIANLANTVAALRQAFGFFWVGFYLRQGDELVLGPFQGPVACTRIALDRGVCGKAARDCQSVVVPNVHEFADHIACSSASQSEIVVPLVHQGKTRLVLDVDAEKLNAFDGEDRQGLEGVVELIAQAHYADKSL